ncbi:hypothetical protein SUGI_0171110 [Cryptomeria japonica]|uniref:protein PAM68, chloroplastic n=1 Tax=Cryptomeria japonica TaxID=3369 RepID=UPI002408F008|nr:protein PAM68, chloroplastic [Cryptomeria japonica]GLJ11560.1 hypothetical protein SUGI_0171110 [Cryptomeria japonica]
MYLACSYHPEAMSSVSYNSLALRSHSSGQFRSGKITQPTSQYIQLFKVGRAEILCSTSKENKSWYLSPPICKSVGKSLFCPGKSQRALVHTKVHALRKPKGFGTVSKKKKNKKKRMLRDEPKREEEEEEEGGGDGDGVIPEIVTNRMIKRMGVSVGIPLAIGLTFFPLFYYMKKVLKWSVPDWLPFITSFITFGSAALGISYGIMSTSWDPLRDGSFLGWTEAQKNWPVFWQSVWQKQGKK